MAAAQASRVASSSNSTSKVCSPSKRFPLSKLSWQETGRAITGRGAQQPPEPEPEPKPEPTPESKLKPERRRPALPPNSAGVIAAAAARSAAKAAACSALVGSSRPSAAEPTPGPAPTAAP